MVIGIHSYNYIVSPTPLQMMARNMIGFAVPLFLAISGYFLSHKDLSDVQKYKSFLSRQIRKIYVPMLIWSVPSFISSIKNGGDICFEMIYLFLGGLSVYYFVSLIIQYYILLPWLKSVTVIGGGVAVIVTLGAVSLSRYCLIGDGVPILFYAGLFPVWLMFFTTGIMLGRENKCKYKLGWFLVLWAFSILIMYAETRHLEEAGAVNAVGIKPSSHLYAFFTIFLLFSERIRNLFKTDNIFFKLVVNIGTASFGIYLVHMYFLVYVIGRLGMGWLPTIMLTLALSWGFVVAVRRLCLGKARFLGFEI